MNTTRNVPRSEVTGHINDADKVFIRLSLSRNDAGDKVFRSLVVDVLPQIWLDSSDPTILELWGKQQHVLDTGDVFFYCGWLNSDTLRQWFDRPDHCTIAGFKQMPGYHSRQEVFALPDTHDTVSAIDLPSYELHGLPTLPYPFMFYTLQPKSPFIRQNCDYKEVVGPNGELFDTFPLAQAEVIFGITDRRLMYGRDDLFAFRVIDARGWLKEIRILPDKVAVTLGATDLLGRGFVVMRGSGLDERAQVFSHKVSLKLPEHIPDDVQVKLLGGATVLDQAVFSSATSPYPKNSPQVIVEREDVFGYVAPATTNAYAEALTTVVAAEGNASPRIFVSHSHKDDAFTNRLVNDLRRAGASVWVDVADLGAGDFQKRINDALLACEWVILVLTENALESPWVEQEVNAALRLKNQQRIREVIPIKASKVRKDIPPLWGVLNIFDATLDYAIACDRVLNAVGITTKKQPTSLLLRFQSIARRLETKEYAEALTLCDDLLQDLPWNIWAWKAKAEALRGLGRDSEASIAENKAKRLDAEM